MSARILIKNMVCPRCVQAVERLLTEQGLAPISVALGEAVLPELPSESGLLQLDKALNAIGFERLEDRESAQITAIKTGMLEYLDGLPDQPHNLSDYLSRRLHLHYSQISKLFSKHQHTTLEKYFIALRIERVKEWLSYQQHSLAQIADRFGYSSTQALSAQFKKVVGVSITEYKHGQVERKSLDAL